MDTVPAITNLRNKKQGTAFAVPCFFALVLCFELCYTAFEVILCLKRFSAARVFTAK